MSSGFTVKLRLDGLKRKTRAWLNAVSKEQQESLRAYSKEFVALAVRFTPPGNGRTSAATARRNLRERIRRDFEGQAGKEQALSDQDLQWRTSRTGQRYVTLPGGKAASPFRAVRGRINAKKLRALNVGKYGVEYAGENLHAFMAARPGQYRWRRQGESKAYHLTMVGARHLATVGSIRAEFRRRQQNIGRLLAGWKSAARYAGKKLPAHAERHAGSGSVRVRSDARHGAMMTAVNRSFDPAMQSIITRNLPSLRKKIRFAARRRVRYLAQKIKHA